MPNIPVIAEINNLLDADTTAIAKTALGVLGAVTTGGALGTPNSGTLTNATDLPIVAGTSGTLTVARGGTGATTALTARANILPTYAANAGKVLAVNSGATDVEYIAAGGNLTSGPVTSSAGVSAIADAALTVAKTSGLAASLESKSTSFNYLRYTVADLANARIGGNQFQLRLYTLGDSWGAINLSGPFRSAFGHYGQILQAQSGTRAGGATLAAQHTKYAIGSYSGDTVLIDASGETLTWSNNSANFEPSSSLIVAYRRTSGGGTFQPQVRNSSGNFVAAGPTISTDGEEGIIWYSYNFASVFGYANAPTQLKIAWVSGASEIVAGGLMDNSPTPTPVFTVVTNDIITCANHNFLNGARVQVKTTITLPTGLSLTTNYYVIRLTANTLKLASTEAFALAGTAVSITAGTGSGTHNLQGFKIRQGQLNRHGVIAYNSQFNGSSAEMWDTIPQQSWNSFMDFMAPQIVFLRDWRETGVNKDFWLGKIQSVMTKIQTGRKSAHTASMIYGSSVDPFTVTSNVAGIAGESLRCRFISNGASQPLTVSVSGNDITVFLATAANSTVLTTVTEVVAKLNEVGSPAAALITASGSGTGLVPSVDAFIPLSTGVGVDFVMLGSNPVSDEVASESLISDALMRDFCIANRIMFIDTRAAFPAYYGDCVKEGFSLPDGLHLRDLGSKLIEKTVFEQLGIRQIGQNVRDSLTNFQTPQFYGGEGVQSSWYSFVNLQSGVTPPSIGFRRTDGGIDNLGEHWKIAPKAKDATSISEGAKETIFAAALLTTKTLRQIDSSGLQAIGYDTDMSRTIGGRLEIGTTTTTATPLVVGAIAAQTVPIISIKTGTAHNASGTQVSGFDKQGIPFVASHTTATRDALTGVIAGSIILNTTTSKLNFYTGSAWEAVTSI